MSGWQEKDEERYDPALEAKAELERTSQQAYSMAWAVRAIGALLLLSVAKLHLSTLAGKVAAIGGPLCFLGAWIISTWARSREAGPEYISILAPEGAKDYRSDRE
ncbi:MAG TPA: hypothetical protein VFR84_13330 [Candidatus Angelobacter sp.]|nr:hypothetical protein [Candidatus Angelobacter sp.]